MNNPVSEAYQIGYDAWLNGEYISDNPYPEGSKQAISWLQGYEDAMEEE